MTLDRARFKLKATLLRQDLLQGDGFFSRVPFTSKGSSAGTWCGLSSQGDEEKVLDDFEIFWGCIYLKKQDCILGGAFRKIAPHTLFSKNLPSKKDYKATDGPWFVCVADSEDGGKVIRCKQLVAEMRELEIQSWNVRYHLELGFLVLSLKEILQGDAFVKKCVFQGNSAASEKARLVKRHQKRSGAS